MRWIPAEATCSLESIEDVAISKLPLPDHHDPADLAPPAQRILIAASMGSEDRIGDILESSGWELEGYRRNPVFLWAHQRTMPPIGRSLRTWIQDDSLQALVEFAPTAFARQIANLFASGFMRGISVGFRPLEYQTRKSSQGRGGYLFKRQELLEISAAPVPMHSEALSLGVDDHATDASTLPAIAASVVELWEAADGLT